MEKLENMVKEGIDKGTYTLTEDKPLRPYELKAISQTKFQRI